MKARKQDRTDVAQKIGETLRRRPNTPKLETWNDLVDNLKKMKVTPGEAYRKLTSENIRFNWKMMRLTMYVWERLKEDKSPSKPTEQPKEKLKNITKTETSSS